MQELFEGLGAFRELDRCAARQPGLFVTVMKCVYIVFRWCWKGEHVCEYGALGHPVLVNMVGDPVARSNVKVCVQKNERVHRRRHCST